MERTTLPFPRQKTRPPDNIALVLYLVMEVNVWIAVAETGNVGHLCVGELQESIPLIVFHVHNVKHRLNVLDIQRKGEKDRGGEHERDTKIEG